MACLTAGFVTTADLATGFFTSSFLDSTLGAALATGFLATTLAEILAVGFFVVFAVTIIALPSFVRLTSFASQQFLGGRSGRKKTEPEARIRLIAPIFFYMETP